MKSRFLIVVLCLSLSFLFACKKNPQPAVTLDVLGPVTPVTTPTRYTMGPGSGYACMKTAIDTPKEVTETEFGGWYDITQEGNNILYKFSLDYMNNKGVITQPRQPIIVVKMKIDPKTNKGSIISVNSPYLRSRGQRLDKNSPEIKKMTDKLKQASNFSTEPIKTGDVMISLPYFGEYELITEKLNIGFVLEGTAQHMGKQYLVGNINLADATFKDKKKDIEFLTQIAGYAIIDATTLETVKLKLVFGLKDIKSSTTGSVTLEVDNQPPS